MQEYDSFAPFYDGVMGDRSIEVARIRQLISHYHPQARSLLELGCGTGSIIAGLAPLLEVSGLERSAAMLEIARTKLPGIKLYQGDITTYDLSQKFDVIICVFDTINHLTDFDGWKNAFQRTKSHLKPNGIFVFDMITTGRVQAVSNVPYYEDQSGGIDVTMDIAGTRANEIEWHISVQTPGADGITEVHEERFREASFPLAQVKAALEPDFKVLHYENTEGRTPTDRSGRVYFVCQTRNS